MAYDPITDAERATFDIVNDPDAPLALLRVQLDGRDRAAVVVVTDDDDGGYRVFPLALLLDDDTTDRLTDSDGDTPQPITAPARNG